MGQGKTDISYSKTYAGPVTWQQGLLWLMLFVALPALLWGIAQSAAPAERLHWDLTLPWSLSEFHTQNALRFADEAQKITQSRLNITVHPGAALGIKGPDSLRAAQDGMVPLVEMAGFQQTGHEAILGLESLPFLIETQDDLRVLYRHLRGPIENAFARHHLKMLYLVPWPSQNIFARKKVSRLGELSGARIRSYDRNTTELMTRLGLAPMQLALPDVLPALASGALDATMTSTTSAAAQKYWQFLPYLYRSNHIWISNMLVVNLEAWHGLSSKDQQAIENLARALEQDFWRISAADDAEKLALLLENGMEIVGPSEEMANEMRALARPMWREFTERVPEARTILDAYLRDTGRAPLSEH